MRLRTLLLAILACSLAFAAMAPAASAQSGFIPVPNQVVNLGSRGAGTLTGIRINSVRTSNGQLLASGIGFVTTSTGTLVGTFNNAPLALSTVPLSGTRCPILHLDIGPIRLNLLGLVVTVPNHTVLDITAVGGAGNLLGNLLCAVANLLNQTPLPLNQIVTVLNQLLAQL
jgi:hypothetical protein